MRIIMILIKKIYTKGRIMRNLNIFVNGNGVVIDLGDKLPTIEEIEASCMETVNENYLTEIIDCDSELKLIIPHNMENSQKILKLRKLLGIDSRIQQSMDVLFVNEFLRYRMVKTNDEILYQKVVGNGKNEYVEPLTSNVFHIFWISENGLVIKRNLLNPIFIDDLEIQPELIIVNNKLYFVLSSKCDSEKIIELFSGIINNFELKADITSKTYLKYFNKSK
jgi:hypothetical protein